MVLKCENRQNRKLCSRQAKRAKKRVLKAEWPNPYLDIYLKKPNYPFSPRPYIGVLFLVILLNMVPMLPKSLKCIYAKLLLLLQNYYINTDLIFDF